MIFSIQFSVVANESPPICNVGIMMAKIDVIRRVRESINLFDSSAECFYQEGFEKSDYHLDLSEDVMFLHVLEAIGALTCIQKHYHQYKNLPVDKLDKNKIMMKRRIFWSTVQEVAKQELLLCSEEKVVREDIHHPDRANDVENVDIDHATEDIEVDKDAQVKWKNQSSERKSVVYISPLHRVLEAFPDKTKQIDGRMWLSHLFAIVVPDLDFNDVVVTLIAAKPHKIRIVSSDGKKFSPIQLATMVTHPQNDLISWMEMFYGYFAVTAKTGTTPMHGAASFSLNLYKVTEYNQMYPHTRLMRDEDGLTPLCCVALNENPIAPKILQFLLETAPQAARMKNPRSNDELPLNYFLSIHPSFPWTEELIVMIFNAYKEAVNIPDREGILPIHLAAQFADVDILKIITEENMANLSVIVPDYGSPAHFAVKSHLFDHELRSHPLKMENLRYLHSLKPDLMVSLDENHHTPLWDAVECNADWDAEFIASVIALAPQAAKIVDVDSNNLLHLLAQRETLECPCCGGSIFHRVECMRILLRYIPEAVFATNSDGLTAYDLMDPDDPRNEEVRRLLLLAGAPSLHPHIRREMNYAARKTMLLTFFAGHISINIFSRIRCAPRARTIMEHVVSYL